MTSTFPTDRENPFDPPFELRRLCLEEPLSRLAFPDGHVGWLATSHQMAVAVLADRRFSARWILKRYPIRLPQVEGLTLGRPAPGFFVSMDPPEHSRYRKLLRRPLTVASVGRLMPAIRRIVADRLDAMADTGPPVDLVSMFALPVSSMVMCELLGLPTAHRAEYQRLTTTMAQLDATDAQVASAMTALAAYAADVVVSKRSEPADDLLSHLHCTGELADDELIGLVSLLLRAHETTAQMIALGAFALLCHPEQLREFREGKASVDATVEELLRYATILQHGTTRTALEDVRLSDHLIRAGDSVSVSLPAANRDPRRFSRPGDLDVSRPARGHLAFGHGVHVCPGIHLARLELRIAYPMLLTRFPKLRLASAPGDVPLRDDMTIYGPHTLGVMW